MMRRKLLSLLALILVGVALAQRAPTFARPQHQQFVRPVGNAVPRAQGAPLVARPRPAATAGGRAFGYQTRGVAAAPYHQGPVAVGPSSAGVVSQSSSAASSSSSCSAGSSGCSSSGYDYNPLLAGGIPGGAGIKARVNQRGFQYASTLIAPILDQQIRSARIPPISQCIPEVNGCIQVYNLYVSRYRCPSRVVVYPAPPNQIVIAVQNMDIGVTGNLGGQINILIPIAITGIIQVNAHQVSVTVALVVDRAPTGGIALRMVSCQVTIGYLDAYIENGGLVGDIANSQFRGTISSRIRQMLPGQLCGQLPNIINQQLNSRLTSLPQSIALTQILQVAGGAFGLDQALSGGGNSQCASSCGGESGGSSSAVASAPQQSAIVSPPQQVAAPLPRPAPSGYQQQAPIASPAVAAPPQQAYQDRPAAPAPAPASVAPPPADPPAPETHSGDNLETPSASSKYSTDSKKVTRVHASGVTRTEVRPLPRPGAVVVSHTSAAASKLRRNANRTRRHAVPQHGGQVLPQRALVAPQRARALAPSPNHVIFASGPNPCASCPGAGQSEGPGGFLMTLAKSLDLSKLSNLYLTIQFLQGYATPNDYTIEVNGEFSPNGQGGTPFGPFPMQFPQGTGGKMVDILVSDYTLNSLFYWMHRSGFLTFRIGPETPKIGELLKTTCSDDEDEGGGIEDHGVELDEESTRLMQKRRAKRQDAGGLSDLGICLGDILPAVREKYPNQKIVIAIHTTQAPSVILSSRNGGSATLTLVADADLFIEATNQKVGTINIDVTADLTVQTTGGRISGHAEITNLKLRDTTGALGLPQDALDNLGNLGKEVIQKAGNDALEKGIALNIPSGIGGLPISIVDPELHITDHAIYIGSNFTVDTSQLGSILGGSGGGGGGSCPRRRKKLH